jgi:tetratricopeptide (TPR) repeat protein
MRAWLFSALIGGVTLSGCYFAQLPDPNEIQGMQFIDAEVMHRNIAQAHADLGRRVGKGEMTPAEKDRRILELVQTIAGYVDVATVPDGDAWRFGDIFRQAGDLKTSRLLYERAVKVAKTDDRRVNDTLQLARVMALQGEVKEAIKTARLTFDAPPKEKAPILLAVLYEIFPAGQGKKEDIELAKLVEDAVGQHLQVQVDPQSEAGKFFNAASQRHISQAWTTIFGVYGRAGDRELFQAAVARREKQAGKMGNF